MTPKMRAALVALVDLTEGHRHHETLWTPNQIGMRMGQPKGRPTRSGSSPTHSRVPSEGSGISSVLRALQTRGLVTWGSRPDGYSGTAYRITQAGRDALDEEA